MIKIDSDKPNLGHTKYRYEECVAKVLLEWVDDHTYQNLLIKDKPDLYCEKSKTGIEVIEAVDPVQKEAENLWAQIPYSPDNKAKKLKRQMKKLGHEYQGGIQIWGGRDYSNDVNSKPYNELYTSIEKKSNTLRKGQYYKCSKYELFVESNIMIEEAWCKNLFDKVNALNSKQTPNFSKIIILFQLSLVFLDFEDKSFKCIQLDSQIYNKLVCKANEMTEAENE